MKRWGDRLTLSWIGIVAVTLVCGVLILSTVLKVPVTGTADEVSVKLPRTGGLFEGSAVTYRGVRVGTVKNLAILEEGGVHARVTLRPGVEVPASSRAVVRSLSPVGEQFLDFRPTAASGPFLADGDVVQAEAKDLPVSLAKSVGSLTSLLDKVDRGDVRTVLRELDTAVGDTGTELDQLLTTTDQLTTDLDRAWPQTERLLRNGEEVGELFASKQGELTRFAAAAREFTEWMRGYNPEFRRILRDAPSDFRQLSTFVKSIEGVLPPFLKSLVALTDITYDREPHLRQLTRMLEYGAGRFASAFRDGWLNIDLTLQGQQTCSYGVQPRDPMSPDRKPLLRTGKCGMDDPVRRGAEHAPPALNR